MEKKEIIQIMASELKSAIQRLEADITAIKEGRQSDTKSSAGDKHETGRAMADQTLIQLEQQKSNTFRSLMELQRGGHQKATRVQVGAMVETEHFVYFISVPFGKVACGGEKPLYAISPLSPAAQVMLDKTKGDDFELNGKIQTIQQVY